MAYNYHKGLFKPQYPHKYKGRSDNIVFRSGLEFRFMQWLDSHPDVLSWASEEHFFVVPYRDPVTSRSRRYFPDFWFERKDANGNVKTFVVEVKPFSQTTPPPLGKNGKLDKRRVHAAMTYATNAAKWKACRQFCESRDWDFKIITEKDIK